MFKSSFVCVNIFVTKECDNGEKKEDSLDELMIKHHNAQLFLGLKGRP